MSNADFKFETITPDDPRWDWEDDDFPSDVWPLRLLRPGDYTPMKGVEDKHGFDEWMEQYQQKLT